MLAAVLRAADVTVILADNSAKRMIYLDPGAGDERERGLVPQAVGN